MESYFHQLSGSIFILVKNTHQKAANSMFGPILPVALTLVWFLEGQYMVKVLLSSHLNSSVVYRFMDYVPQNLSTLSMLNCMKKIAPRY